MVPASLDREEGQGRAALLSFDRTARGRDDAGHGESWHEEDAVSVGVVGAFGRLAVTELTGVPLFQKVNI